jgi:ethanolamine ammonia-lyase small subunit
VAKKDDNALAASDLPETVRRIRARTPARILVGRAGAAYRTNTYLDLREAHAAARDAVGAELRVQETFGSAFIERWGLFELKTRAASKEEFLLRPDLGRRFDEPSRAEIVTRCSAGSDLQFAIGDGLSVASIATQIPSLLPLLMDGACGHGWTIGRPFIIRHCRVGILNEIGELLNPRVVVLLIGERPGLAFADSLSAYLAYQPRPSHTDANRNLISNIHSRGVDTVQASRRILNFAAQVMSAGTSGYQLHEAPPSLENS